MTDYSTCSNFEKRYTIALALPNTKNWSFVNLATQDPTAERAIKDDRGIVVPDGRSELTDHFVNRLVNQRIRTPKSECAHLSTGQPHGASSHPRAVAGPLRDSGSSRPHRHRP